MQKRVLELDRGVLVRDEECGVYSDCIVERELNFERSDVDIAELDEAIFDNLRYEERKRLARREKQSAEIKSMIDEDRRKRRNRLSLAERIAKMRMLAEDIDLDDYEKRN